MVISVGRTHDRTAKKRKKKTGIKFTPVVIKNQAAYYLILYPYLI